MTKIGKIDLNDKAEDNEDGISKDNDDSLLGKKGFKPTDYEDANLDAVKKYIGTSDEEARVSDEKYAINEGVSDQQETIVEDVGRIKKIGDISEAVGKESLGPDAINLNDLKPNYPVYDLDSDDMLVSVKTHDLGSEEKNLAAYKKDFSKMQGWGRSFENGKSPREQDIDLLRDTLKNQEEKEEIDTDDTLGSDDVIENKVKNSVLQVPDDHVEPLKEYIREDAKILPENYDLSSNPSDEELDQLGSRFGSIGLTSEEIKNQVDQED